MTQHRAWKPDSVALNDRYVAWDEGWVSKSQVGAWGTGSSKGRNRSTRVYFESVEGFRILEWTRNFKKWHVVRVVLKDGRGWEQVYYSRRLEDAQRFVDAFEVLRAGAI